MGLWHFGFDRTVQSDLFGSGHFGYLWNNAGNAIGGPSSYMQGNFDCAAQTVPLVKAVRVIDALVGTLYRNHPRQVFNGDALRLLRSLVRGWTHEPCILSECEK